jgi:hypothetical protein
MIILKTLKKDAPLNVGAILLISLSIWVIHYFSNSQFILESNTTFIYQLLFSPFKNYPSIITIFTFLLLSFKLFLLKFISEKYKLVGLSGFIVPFVYLLSVSTTLSDVMLHPILIANLFIILALLRIFSLSEEAKAGKLLFDIGFLIALSSMFYTTLLLLLLLIWISLFLIKPFKLSEWLASLLGVILPYIILFSITYLFDNTAIFVNHFDLSIFKEISVFKPFNINRAAMIFPLIGLLIFPFAYYEYIERKLINKLKNYHWILLYLFIITELLFILGGLDFVGSMLLCAPFLAFYLTVAYISIEKSWIMESFVMIWVILIISSLLFS